MSVERATVAFVLALLLITSGAAADVVHLKDGSRVSGTLTFCDEEVCVASKRRIARSDIELILFRDDVPLPSGVRGVVFTDGSVRGGTFTGLTLGYVELNGDEIDRERVAAIVLVPIAKVPEEEKPPGFTRPVDPAPPEEAPPPPPAPPAQPPPTSPPTAPPPAPPPATQPPASPPQPPGSSSDATRGALWTGTIEGRGWGTTDGIFSDLRITANVRMREYIRPLVIAKDGKIRTIGTLTQLEPEGTVVRNVYRCSSQYLYCEGEGTTTVTIAPDQQGIGHPSWIYHKTAPDSMQPGHGFDIPQGAAMYTLAIDIHIDTKYPVMYRSSATSYEDSGFIVWMAGMHPLAPPEVGDHEIRYVQGGKMIGSYTSPGSGAFPQISLSWSVCREGVQCPQAPPLPGANDDPLPPRELPENPDPCAELEQLIQAMRALRETYEIHQADFTLAQKNRDVVRDSIWGLDGALRKYFTSMLSLAATGASAALKKAISVAKTIMGLEGSPQDLYSAAKALGYGPQDILRDAAAKEAMRAAVQRADEYLARTGDHQGALRLYAGSIERSEKLAGAAKKVTTGIGAVTGALDYAQKTSALADLIQEYLEYDADAKRAQNDMDGVQDRMRDLQLRIDAARRGCPNASLGYAVARLRGSRVSDRGAIFLVAVSQPLHARLRALQAKLEQLPAHYEGAAMWLLPFLFDEPMSPALAAALAGEALPQLEAAEKTLGEAQADEESFQREMENAVPRETGAAKPPQT